MIIRAFNPDDIPEMIAIWNCVVREGNAFPQDTELDEAGGMEFFSSQSFTGVAEENGCIVGLYVLHPNNVGHCGHIANASYAVASECRGRHIGEALVRDSLSRASALGFRILQFNAVVASNIHAHHLYRRLGFAELGMIPGGFCRSDGSYEDIISYYRETE